MPVGEPASSTARSALRFGVGHGGQVMLRLVRRAVVIVVPGERRQHAGADQQRKRPHHVEPMPQLPAADERHQEQRQHHQPGHDDRADDRRKHFQILQQLKQEQKVSFRPGGGVAFGRIGRCAELGAELLRERHARLGSRIVSQHQHQHDDRHGQAGHRVAQHLLGPERGVRRAVRLADREAVAAEQRTCSVRNTVSSAGSTPACRAKNRVSVWWP